MFDWIAKIAFQKALAKGLKGGVATFAGAMTVLGQFGVTVQIDQAILASAVTSGVLALYEFIRNWLKSKGIKQLP